MADFIQLTSVTRTEMAKRLLAIHTIVKASTKNPNEKANANSIMIYFSDNYI